MVYRREIDTERSFYTSAKAGRLHHFDREGNPKYVFNIGQKPECEYLFEALYRDPKMMGV